MFNDFVFKHSLINKLDRQLFKKIKMYSLSKSTKQYHNILKMLLYKVSQFDVDDIFDNLIDVNEHFLNLCSFKSSSGAEITDS